MTPESQRIAIAKACGEWSWWLWGRDQFVITAPRNINLSWSGEDKATNSMRWPLNGQSLDEAARDLMLQIIPDYLGDLNAIHEAEKVLGREQIHKYLDELEHLVIREHKFLPTVSWLNWLCIHSTAAQRAEALLRTLNLWVEEPVSEATVEGLR